MTIFKEGFFWGGSASCMQTEGAARIGGKGLTIYDTGHSVNARHGDWENAIDFYHRYQEDIDLMAGMGFNAYRTSLSWARVLPDGETEVNEEGLAFYDKVIDVMMGKGIEPILCLYHFDLPEALYQKYGGWQDRHVLDAFVKYAQIVMQHFKGRVKYYIPFNEENVSIILAGMDSPAAAHHIYMASAFTKKYAMEIDPSIQVGGIVNIMPFYPETCRPADVFAAQCANQLFNYDALDVFAKGTYPAHLIKEWAEKGWIPQEDDLKVLRLGKMDYLGFSYYQSAVVNGNGSNKNPLANMMKGAPKNPYLKETEWGWKIDPEGLRLSAKELYDRYQMPLFVMECGIGVNETLNENHTVEDDYRIDYFRDHIRQLQLAVKEDDVDLMGFLTWGPIDILSSQGDMNKRYGFVYVNRTNDDLLDMKRYPKKSYAWFKSVIESNGEILES